jgi:hypothetical protein
MRIALIALLLIAQDDVMKGWKHPWAGATVGTRLKWKSTLGERSSEVTWVVAKADDKNVELKEGKRTQQFYIGLPSEYEGKAVKGAEEEIKVGEKSLKCTVYEITKTSGKITQTMKVWKCADAPVFAVKEQWSQGKSGWTTELTAIDEVVKVGGKEYKCAVLRKTTEVAGIKAVETVWWNDEIPGRAAKRTRQSFIKDQELKEQGSVEELVEFEKK